MTWISLGLWSHSAGSVTVSDRIYRASGQWTPFIHVRFRYEFWQWVSQHLPRRLVYHTVITATAAYSTSKEGEHTHVPDICAMTVSKWWETHE